jgi:hypothetical protein
MMKNIVELDEYFNCCIPVITNHKIQNQDITIVEFVNELKQKSNFIIKELSEIKYKSELINNDPLYRGTIASWVEKTIVRVSDNFEYVNLPGHDVLYNRFLKVSIKTQQHLYHTKKGDYKRKIINRKRSDDHWSGEIIVSNEFGSSNKKEKSKPDCDIYLYIQYIPKIVIGAFSSSDAKLKEAKNNGFYMESMPFSIFNWIISPYDNILPVELNKIEKEEAEKVVKIVKSGKYEK